MTYCQFIAAVKEEVECNVDGNVKIDVHIALKNNDKERRGLVFQEEGINISPAIYLEEAYKEFQEGKDLHKIVHDILEVYESARFSKRYEVDNLREFDKIRKNVLCKLINREKNKEFLKDTHIFHFLI